jgi:hypothetical protein
VIFKDNGFQEISSLNFVLLVVFFARVTCPAHCNDSITPVMETVVYVDRGIAVVYFSLPQFVQYLPLLFFLVVVEP